MLSRAAKKILSIESDDLTPLARLVLMILAVFANRDSGTCFPTRATLSKAVGVNIKTLDRGLKELREQGYVSWLRTLDSSNRYTVHPEVGRPKAPKPPRHPNVIKNLRKRSMDGLEDLDSSLDPPTLSDD